MKGTFMMFMIIIFPFRNALSAPVLSFFKKNSLWCVLQITEPLAYGPNQTRIKRKKGFSIRDELIMNLYSRILTLIIDAIIYQEKLKKAQRNYDSFVDIGNLFSVFFS